MSALAPTLEAFFTERLIGQRQVSPHTVAAYRDTFRLLLKFIGQRTGKSPSRLDIGDLNATLIGAFLDHLEQDRGNSPRTRNARLAAIHSLFRFAALRHPDHAELIQRVLAIPSKRHLRTEVTFLHVDEVDALLAAPDRSSRHGRRDHAQLVLATQTGLRVSELTRLRCDDLHLDAGPHVRCHGKGRKERIIPLSAQTVDVLHAWLREHNDGPGAPLFPSRRGGHLSHDAVERLVVKHSQMSLPAPARPCAPRPSRLMCCVIRRRCACWKQGSTRR